MTPQVLVVYTNTLFARGVAHLLASHSDCTVAGTLHVAELTPDRLANTPATVIILEGDEADSATGAAMRMLQGRGAAFVLIRVNLSAPTLHVYRCDRPVPARLDELAGIIRSLADLPGLQVAEDHSLEARA